MRAFTKDEIDSFIRGYKVCALWSSTDSDNKDEPFDLKFDIRDFSSETAAQMEKDCRQFIAGNEEQLLIYVQNVARFDTSRMDTAGFDFWLSRNGHGAGYFSRDNIPEATQEALQEAARQVGECSLYVHKGQIWAL